MGWWEVDNSVDVLGDGPADQLSEALNELKELYGSIPPLEEVLQATLAAIHINPVALLLDPQPPVTGLMAELNDRTMVSVSSSVANRESVKRLYQAFEDIALEYLDMEDHRKPRLSEVLGTLAFIAGPDNQDFIETPNGKGIAKINAKRSAN